MNYKNKIKGCMMASAIGDALGYEVEFDKEPAIFKRFGPLGIQDYVLHNGYSLVSDDTQMSMFSANAMIVASNKQEDVMEVLKKAYYYWYLTQVLDYDKLEDPQTLEKDFYLMNDRRLYQNRAPGITCMDACSAGCKGSFENLINHSKGCGGIMRIAPIACAYDLTIDSKEVAMLCAKASALTHTHELGYLPSAYLGYMLHQLIHSNQSIEALHKQCKEVLQTLFPKAIHLNELLEITDLAIELSHQNLNDLDAIHQLKEGWVAEETLAIALYCANKYSDDFTKAITTAVNHNGDSDSTGAVCGNILGAYLGYDKIPSKYIESLEMKDLLERLIHELCLICRKNDEK